MTRWNPPRFSVEIGNRIWNTGGELDAWRYWDGKPRGWRSEFCCSRCFNRDLLNLLPRWLCFCLSFFSMQMWLLPWYMLAPTSTPHTAFQFANVWGPLLPILEAGNHWRMEALLKIRPWLSPASVESLSVCKRNTALLTSPQPGPSWVIFIWNITMHARTLMPLILLP